jgi:hypothetical protein
LGKVKVLLTCDKPVNDCAVLVANAGLAVLVEVPELEVSATAREPLEGVSAISNGVTGLAFFGGLPRFTPPTGRLLLISFLGGMILG